MYSFLSGLYCFGLFQRLGGAELACFGAPAHAPASSLVDRRTLAFFDGILAHRSRDGYRCATVASLYSLCDVGAKHRAFWRDGCDCRPTDLSPFNHASI